MITIPTFINLIISPPIFTAWTTILPEEDTNINQLELAASQFTGMSLGSKTENFKLYESVITSRRVLYEILQSKFSLQNSEEESSLLDILEIEAESIEERLDKGQKILLSNINVSISKTTKITTVEVDSKDPKLSADIVLLIVSKLDNFFRNLRMDKASESKKFIESRVSETLVLLEINEENLKAFRELNKRIEKSAQLQLEQERLLREVRVQEEVYLTLKKELEITKIEEVKNLQMISILDKATPPINKSKPNRRKIMSISIFFAIFFSIIIPLVLESAKNKFLNHENSIRFLTIFLPIQNDLKKALSLVLNLRGQKVEEHDENSNS